MKKYVVMDILDIIFIPLITYLLLGLLVIQNCGVMVDITRFVMWAVMAGIVLGIQKWFSNKAVTMGIVLYSLLMVCYFIIGDKEEGILNAILICISFVAIIAFRFMMRNRLVKIAAGYGIIIYMIYCSFINVEISKILISFAIILFLNAISETIAVFYHGNVKSLIVIYIMVAVFTLMMPVSKEPYDWAFVFKVIDSVERVVDRIVTEINYQLADAGVDGIFHFGNTGYSDSYINLSNSLLEQDVEQLVLEGQYTKRNLYLKGNVCNEYTGNGWITNISGETLDYKVDTLMTLYAIFKETEDLSELRRFMEIKEQKIILQNIKTQSLFYPMKLLDITVEDAGNEGDMLRASKINGRGYSYSYWFVDIDYANKQMINILKDSKGIVYEEETYNRIYTNLKNLYGIEIEPIPFEEFCQMAEKSYELAQKQYKDPGEQVSENVKNLAKEIVKDTEGDYEVCKTLEKYLYRYNYNKEIKVLDGVNVLDWFLFEGKEGYCAHYATALAVMLRCENIPSRVAEGFLVDYTDKRDIYVYSISSNKAHAWVEAYIDGFGWVRLEPTVVNAANANAVWYADETYEEEEIQKEEVGEIIHEQEEKEEQKISWVLMIKLLAGMIVIVGIILVALFIYKKIAIRNSYNPDIVFAHMILVLEKKYFAKETSETLSEYFKRLKNETDIHKEVCEELAKIQAAMELYWYGNKTVPMDIIVKMKNLSRIN